MLLLLFDGGQVWRTVEGDTTRYDSVPWGAGTCVCPKKGLTRLEDTLVLYEEVWSCTGKSTGVDRVDAERKEQGSPGSYRPELSDPRRRPWCLTT